MLTGCRLDEDRIAALLEGDPLVIAHHTRFDRPFVEARLPHLSELGWACSMSDIDWKREGIGSCKLDYIAGHMGWFFDAHRAEADCQALLAVLDRPLPRSGRTGFAHLLAAHDLRVRSRDESAGSSGYPSGYPGRQTSRQPDRARADPVIG
jgi:DNA polymerase-3 subunit epsilon